MSSIRPELHVAQQIRRDKLRIQNLQQQHFPNLEEQLSLHQNMDLLQLHHHHHHHDQQQSLYSSSSQQQQQCLVNNNNTYYYPNNNNNNNNFMINYATLSSTVANNHNSHLVTVATPSPHNSSSNSSSSSVVLYNHQNSLQDILNHHHHHHHNPNYVDNYTPATASASGWSNHNNNQGLSLSLSSSSPILSHHHHHHNHNQNVHVKTSTTSITTNQNANNATSSSSSGSYYYRNSVGPLGPFTGYATILKSSRFLKPCQKLLDEYCRRHCSAPSEWPSTTSADHDDGDGDDDQSDGLLVSEKGGGSSSSNKEAVAGCSSSSSIFHGPSTSSSSLPECQKNKAKLLFMQDEVTRRYKQYHQQMQMVISSFESVAGLNSATPYASLALKLVTKNFKSLKNSISDQLKLICQALGEDSAIPPAAANTSSQFESNAARLRCMDQTLHRNKPGGSGGGGNMDFEPQQHVWRPQRGLPERAVAILKAWLFEHFLHPYPTDTDKHMLATQTGLSRNQVSNWFINARVRVWKPMVEEIHMLETKGANQISSNRMGEGTSATNDGSNHAKVLGDQPLNKFAGAHTAANPILGRQFQCLEMGSSSSLLVANANEENDDLQQHEEVQWSQEKRSKLESMDGGLIGLMPYRRTGGGGGGGEFGGLGPVSLTLELRHGVEGSQQQIQGHEEQLRHHFGGMIS